MILDNVLAGLKTSEASIDTFNSWSKNTYTSVAGWRLFDDSSERFGVSITLARKIKAVNLAGGGYVSAQFVDGFESVAAATQWAKANRVTINKPFAPVEPEQEDARTYWETPECPDDLALKVTQPAQLTGHIEKTFLVKVITYGDDSTFENADFLMVKAASESEARFAAIDTISDGEIRFSGANLFADDTGYTYVADSVKEVADQDAEILKQYL